MNNIVNYVKDFESNFSFCAHGEPICIYYVYNRLMILSFAYCKLMMFSIELWPFYPWDLLPY